MISKTKLRDLTEEYGVLTVDVGETVDIGVSCGWI